MTFWQENYSFIKEVYDTRHAKMVDWMDNIEMAIQKVCANRVYSSAEYKREKDNFQSLCKNLDRVETKRWLTETLETLMKERAGEEKKEEQKKLEAIIERHKNLIPKINETLIKTECYWKCYSYGDDLVPIFEFIDELRLRSTKEVHSGNQEQTEEHIEKQDKVLTMMENKKKMIQDFIAKGEKLMEDPNSPKFLEGHLKKILEAWEDAMEKTQKRKVELQDNFNSWETFEYQKVDCHKTLDETDKDCASIKKIFDLRAGPADFKQRRAKANNQRAQIEEMFNTISACNDCVQMMLPLDRQKDMKEKVEELKKRMDVLGKMDEKLALIEDFNNRLGVFDSAVSDVEAWLKEVRKKIDEVKSPATSVNYSPEDRVTLAMEIHEDIAKKSEFLRVQEEERLKIFPTGDDKVTDNAARFISRLEKARAMVDDLTEEVKTECTKFSQDIKFWAEFQTGIKVFEPWMLNAEKHAESGLKKPETLAEAIGILNDVKDFQGECERKLALLQEAANSAQKMTVHEEADNKVEAFKKRWTAVHETTKEWIARMSTLVECWSKLEGNVEELNQWVEAKPNSPEDLDMIPMEKLEGQLNQLKNIFAEKQHLVEELEEYGRKRGINGNGDEPPAKIAPAAATAQPNVDEEAAQVTAEPQPAPVEAAA